MFPRGLAFDSAGFLYAANGNNTIVRFDAAGTPFLFANTGLHGPVGIGFDSQGNLYAVNDDNSTIVKFDASGTPTLFANNSLNTPYLIAIQVPEPCASGMLAMVAALTGLARLRCRRTVKGS
jgi:DNA-binding beta-propeller fold protein YncE